MQKMKCVVTGFYIFGQDFFMIRIFGEILYKNLKTNPAKEHKEQHKVTSQGCFDLSMSDSY